MTEILDISEFLQDPTEPAWEPYPEIPGFEVLLRLPDAPELFGLSSKSWEGEGDHRQFEAGKFFVSEVFHCLTDWRGLTLAGLKQLLDPGVWKAGKTGKAKASEGAVVPFSPATKTLILKNSLTFLRWLHNRIYTRKNLAEGAEKNS